MPQLITPHPDPPRRLRGVDFYHPSLGLIQSARLSRRQREGRAILGLVTRMTKIAAYAAWRLASMPAIVELTKTTSGLSIA